MSEQRVFDLYRSLNLWTNPTCTRCKLSTQPPLFGPVGIWQVGKSYFDDRYRIVFVGKNARGSIRVPGEELAEELAQHGFIDATCEADQWIGDTRSAYWSYTAAIVEELFGNIDVGWERVAFTNLVKCNNSMDVDTTTAKTASHCLDELGVVWKEIELLEPNHIIMFTGWDYDTYIDRYLGNFDGNDETRRDHQIPNGGKMMLWWERHCVTRSGRKFKILRTSHPERQKKESFVNQIVQWIVNGK